jgi:SAM-dependent methyltransferase
MHGSVMAWGTRVLTAERVRRRRVLEVGAFNVNGSLRQYVEALKPEWYVGTDVREGPGVDVVCPAEQLGRTFQEYEHRFDLVISTEMLEHAQDWAGALSGMLDVLRPQGLLLLTCRGPGYPRHDYPGDHWRFSVDTLVRCLAPYLAVLEATSDPEARGAFFLGQKVASAPTGLPQPAPELEA